MIRFNNRWWHYDGKHGLRTCAGGHKIGRCWMYEGPDHRDYCRPCAIRLLKAPLPRIIDWRGWSNLQPEATRFFRHA